MDLSSFYDQLPPTLEDKLALVLHTLPDEGGLLLVVTIRTDIINKNNKSIDLITPQLDKFKTILNRINEDISFLNPDLSQQPLKIQNVSPQSATIKVHTTHINNSTNYGTHNSGINQYINQQGLRCTKYLGKNNNYYTFEVKPPTEKELQECRDQVICKILKQNTLTCPHCQTNAVTIGKSNLTPHCSSCGHTPNQLNKYNYPLYENITNILKNRWTENIQSNQQSTTPNTFNGHKLNPEEMTTLQENPTVYFHTFHDILTGDKRQVIYIKLQPHGFWVPFNTGSKDMYKVRTITNNDQHICYICANPLENGTHALVDRFGIPHENKEQIFQENVCICDNCISNFESQFHTILKNNSDLNAKILAQTL